MKIYGCVSGFNEEANLERCFTSLIPKVDVLVYVDGAYRKFPCQHPYSTDDSINIAHEFADVVMMTEKPWENEVQKRNTYLIAEPGDLYIILDADEQLKGDVRSSIEQVLQNHPDAQDFRIDFHRRTLPIMSLCSRVFYHRRGIHYFGAHNALWLGDNLLNHIDQPILKGGRVYHYTDEREKKRVEAKGEYYRGLQKDELKFRETYHI